MQITKNLMPVLKKMMLGTALAASLAGGLMPSAAQADDKKLESIGISVGLLGNPFFVATIKGIEDRKDSTTLV